MTVALSAQTNFPDLRVRFDNLLKLRKHKYEVETEMLTNIFCQKNKNYIEC